MLREKTWFRAFLVASTFLIISFAMDAAFIKGFEPSLKSFLWAFLKACIFGFIIILTFGNKEAGGKRRR